MLHALAGLTKVEAPHDLSHWNQSAHGSNRGGAGPTFRLEAI